MEKADLLLQGASFFCGLGLNSKIDFIAIKGNRILKVGTFPEMEAYIDQDTRVVSYTKDQLIMPGFYDSHTHIISAGMADQYPDFGACKSEEETAKAAKAYSDAHPEEEWVFGFNWYHVYWGQQELPTAKTLDQFFPDKPVMLTDAEGHGVWVNSKAMELCGITKETEDPPYGKLERYEDGTPTGFFHEMAIGLIARVAYDFPEEIEARYIRDYMRNAVKLGITAANDMLPYYGNDMGKPECFAKLAGQGEFLMRLHSAPNVFGDLEHTKEVAQRVNGSMYQVKLLKGFVDGVPTTYTSYMLEPFIDNPEEKGGTLSDLELLREAILTAHKNGWSVRLHCCGDGAAHYALDCVEEATNKFGYTGARHAVEHFETTIPEDIQRAAKLGVIASMQPEHLAMTQKYEENPYLIRYNERQKRYAWAINSFMKAGVTVAFGSDCPVVTNNPFVSLYRAVTRVHNDGMPVGGWNPEEKITMEQALDAYTLKGYFGVGREMELGTLEEGKLADLIVLDQNLLSIDPEKIRDTKVLFTIVDGKIVYEK